MMLTTGNQLKAARMLAELDQLTLAESSKVSIGTVRNMEARGAKTLRSNAVCINAVVDALGRAGVEFLEQGTGVRLMEGSR